MVLESYGSPENFSKFRGDLIFRGHLKFKVSPEQFLARIFFESDIFASYSLKVIFSNSTFFFDQEENIL